MENSQSTADFYTAGSLRCIPMIRINQKKPFHHDGSRLLFDLSRCIHFFGMLYSILFSEPAGKIRVRHMPRKNIGAP